MPAPNVLTISPALPFLDTFVAAFLAGEVVAGAPGRGPLALADATIYVPTRRAAQALADTFLAAAGTPSLVLPRILPLGALEETESEVALTEPEPGSFGLPLPPAAGSVWRRLQLATLIQAWSRAVEGALCGVDAAGVRRIDPSEAFRVATSPTDAFALAGDLASLMDELTIEGVEWRALDALRMAGFDDYWRITTSFLDIAFAQWPRTLEVAGLLDPATRRLALVEAQARLLAEDGPAGPVVAIGSTGTNKATANLLAAIARAPQGAVVLPGLDLDLDDAAFALVAGAHGQGQEPSHGHPQAALARLLPVLGVARADVRTLGVPDETAALRARFVAEALRPADTTDQWRAWRRVVSQRAVSAALAAVTLVEAADEREEALCLAIAMREAIEVRDRTAALVTPDRELARRVRGELMRWDLEVYDTGGTPLAAAPLGVLARLVAAAGAPRFDARDIAALLAHPLAAFGRPRAEIARLAGLFEIGVLRVVPLEEADGAALVAAARSAAADRHAHPAQKAITVADWAALARLWDEVVAALAPLRAVDGAQPAARWVAAHRDCLACIADAAAPEETETLEALLDELDASGEGPLAFERADYAALFARLAGEATIADTRAAHPRLAIYGLLEARMMRADVMLLGGLDEGIWPPQATSDPFLNRPMRAELGLLPPERRIGQTAHDFAQAMGASMVVLSRARKRGGAPSVASRMLIRMAALGDKAWEACRARGEHYLWLARALDRPMRAPVAVARPRPTPPVAMRPARLSVTEVETLRRDPYAIFAAKVLRLAKLPKLEAIDDPGLFGHRMHGALHVFVREASAHETAAARRRRLVALLEETFAAARADPLFATFRWPNVLKAADTFLAFDAGQRETLADCLTETSGKLVLDLADRTSFTLTARADRIDLHRDGRAVLVDYKTGQPPGRSEVQVGFAPQLTLEAAILQAGGFPCAPAGAVGATYLKLGGKDGGFVRDLVFDDETFEAVVARHLEGLRRLASSFRNVETPYPSRPFPKYARESGDFDHLARVREWSLAADDEAAT